jgi:hypothetical protein
MHEGQVKTPEFDSVMIQADIDAAGRENTTCPVATAAMRTLVAQFPALDVKYVMVSYSEIAICVNQPDVMFWYRGSAALDAWLRTYDEKKEVKPITVRFSGTHADIVEV